MADNIKFKQGSLSALSKQTITNGTLWFTTDENAIYLDTNGSRIRFGDYVTVANVASLPSAGHAYESALYYAKEENILARWDSAGNKWVQLNAAGLSEIKVEGSGNVLASANVTYDADKGRKILTFTTASVATSENLAQLQTKVTGIEADLDKVEAKLADVNEGETVGGLISAAKEDLQGKIDVVEDKADQGIADAAAAKEYAEGVQSNLNQTNTDLSGLSAKVTNLEAAVGEGGTVDEKIENAVTDLIGTTEDEAGAETIYGALNAADAAQDAADAAQDTADEALDKATTNAGVIGGLQTDMTGAQADISGLKADVAVLKGDADTEGSVAYQIAEIVADAPEDFDTLKEIADWISNDTSGAAALNTRIANAEKKNQEQDTAITGINATIEANKTAAETAVSNLETSLKGDAETYTDLGKAEDAIQANATAVAKAQQDATKGIQDAAKVQENLNATNTTITGIEASVSGLDERLTAAEGDIADLKQADIDMAAAYAAADTQVKNDLIGNATTYTNLGLVETKLGDHNTAIQNINTSITAINATLTWEVFQ